MITHLSTDTTFLVLVSQPPSMFISGYVIDLRVHIHRGKRGTHRKEHGNKISIPYSNTDNLLQKT